MSTRRVVVTGLGMVSPLGLTVAETWRNILEGKSGVAPIEHFDATGFPCRICANLKNFDPKEYFSVKELRKMDLFAAYGMIAADEAIKDAGIDTDNIDPHRIGVAAGSGIGGISAIESSYLQLKSGGPRKVSPFFIPNGIVNMLPGHISIKHGYKGPNVSIVTACTTGTHNIGHAARMIKYGDAEVMIAGGAEMASTDLCFAGFSSARALSTRNNDPEKASRPWDEGRDGFVLGEGAGMLVLEDYEFAKKRGAHIYAEVTGFGMSADAFHITSPDPSGEGAEMSMRNAIYDAKLDPELIDYINAHGTSTPVGDEIEALAVKKTFGSHAKKLAVSSTKSMIGHLLGAAGSVEAIFSILAIRDQVAPPTINLDKPSEGCDLNFVPHTAQPMKIDHALSNSFGFGNTNGSIIISKLVD